MSVGLKGRKTSFPEKSGGVNPYKQFFSGRSWLKNLTHADESAIRTWVQRRLKPSTSASNSFPTFAVDIETNLLLYYAPSLPQR